MITLNHNEIKQIMAHRHPMLLVDRVIELVKGKYIVAEKNITANEPCYQYIPHDMYNLSAFAYPVSLLIESFGQAMCILVAETNEINLNTSIQIPVFGFVQGGHFYEDAYPGDTMIHKGKIIKNTGDAVFCEGETFVGNKCIAKVEMAAIALKSAEMVLSKNN